MFWLRNKKTIFQCALLSGGLEKYRFYLFDKLWYFSVEQVLYLFDHLRKSVEYQGSKILLVPSYLRVPRAAGQVKILIFLVKIKFRPYMPIIFVMQGKCLFSDISRPEYAARTVNCEA